MNIFSAITDALAQYCRHAQELAQTQVPADTNRSAAAANNQAAPKAAAPMNISLGMPFRSIRLVSPNGNPRN